MHNRKNVVLMFLIIMLSFAMVSEVSAVALDDADPSESRLNGLKESFNSPDPQIPAKDFMKYGGSEIH